jgi:hypothetical protein
LIGLLRQLSGVQGSMFALTENRLTRVLILPQIAAIGSKLSAVAIWGIRVLQMIRA